MKAPRHLLAIGTALLFGSAGLFAQTAGTTTGGTTTGTTSTGTATTGTTVDTTTGTTTGGTTTGGTSTGDTTTGKRGKANPHTPNAHASDTAKAVQSVLQRFDENRDKMIADRKALLDQLAAAQTEAERKAILEQLRTEKEEAKQQRTQLGKEVREEIKKLREQRKAGG